MKSSDDADGERRDGPVEGFAFPTRLTAHVVQPGERPRIHGFDVQADLAIRYSSAELFLIALTGEAPNEENGRAFEITASFLAPTTVGEAPAHAGVLARLCGATTSATIATVSLTLAEQARFAVQRYFEWREGVSGAASRTEGDAKAIERLWTALPPSFQSKSELLSPAPTLELGCLSVLFACGLCTSDLLEAALVWARLPCAVAEALAVRPGAFREYPMDLPPFRYEDDR